MESTRGRRDVEGRYGEVPERSKGADCKSAGLAPSEVRILPSPPPDRECARATSRVTRSSGNSSAGRASAFQAEGRGFESRFPLQVCGGDAGTIRSGGQRAHVAQSVEHFLGKEEVTGSNPVMGSSRSVEGRGEASGLRDRPEDRGQTARARAQAPGTFGSWPRSRRVEAGAAREE